MKQKGELIFRYRRVEYYVNDSINYKNLPYIVHSITWERVNLMNPGRGITSMLVTSHPSIEVIFVSDKGFYWSESSLATIEAQPDPNPPLTGEQVLLNLQEETWQWPQKVDIS